MLVVGLFFFLGCSVWADGNMFMRAVVFALTGTETTDLKVVDQFNCVFAVKNELFRLNNVYTDRIKIQSWHERRFGKIEDGVTVELEGGEIVFETTIEPPNDDGSELSRQMRAESPDMFKSHHYSYTRHKLFLATNDQDEVKRAWQYVYSHGCSGKAIPR
jgi:hypothetical protein